MEPRRRKDERTHVPDCGKRRAMTKTRHVQVTAAPADVRALPSPIRAPPCMSTSSRPHTQARGLEQQNETFGTMRVSELHFAIHRKGSNPLHARH